MDDFYIARTHYYKAEHEILSEHLKDCYQPQQVKIFYRKDIPSYEPFSNNLAPAKIRLLHATLERLIFHLQKESSKARVCFIHFFRELYGDLIDAELPLSAADLAGLIDAIISSQTQQHGAVCFEKVLELTATYIQMDGLKGSLRAVLLKLMHLIESGAAAFSHQQGKALLLRCKKLTGQFDPVQEIQSLFPDQVFRKRPGSAPDKFPSSKKGRFKDAQQMISDFLLHCESNNIDHSLSKQEIPLFQEILAENSCSIDSLVQALLIRFCWFEIVLYPQRRAPLSLLYKSLEHWSIKEASSLYFLIDHAAHLAPEMLPILDKIMHKVESWIDANGLDKELRKKLLGLSRSSLLNRKDRQSQKVYTRIQDIISGKSEKVLAPSYHLPELDHFGLFANQLLLEMDPASTSLWYQLLVLCEKAGKSRPNAGFLKKTKLLFDQFAAPQFLGPFKAILSHTIKMPLWTSTDSPYLFCPDNRESMRGLLWCSSHFEDEDLHLLLADVAERGYRKLYGKKSAAASVSNAAIYTLGQSKGIAGLAHLSRLKWRIKNFSVTRIVERYLDSAATVLGLDKLDLEDLSVPDFGLKEGSMKMSIGPSSAVIDASKGRKTKLIWLNSQGDVIKQAPKIVRQSFKTERKALKHLASSIQKNLQAQKQRIDRSLLLDRRWSFPFFQEHFLNHGLLGLISRKLILEFRRGSKSTNGIFQDGSFVNRQGKKISGINSRTTVSLWHPISKSSKEVAAWQQFIEHNEIKQPIKQAHREIYRLTAAEEGTEFYSNRMAAHILRQHQFNSLGRSRGWRYSMLGNFDHRESDAISFELPSANIKAEYWVSEVDNTEHMDPNYLWKFISTDQVRFTDLRSMQAMSLASVPPLVFSELMRDVDLFVGVASIGNDPNWEDRGGITEHRDYWHNFSFGELSSTARTRKKILQNLLPKLKIAKKCKISGRFLVVKGKLRIYKIHLGSTNILMEPNNEYLCIVSDQSKKEKNVFLPFEGDQQLSIILSKAFMLTEDDKIDDKTIMSQILS